MYNIRYYDFFSVFSSSEKEKHSLACNLHFLQLVVLSKIEWVIKQPPTASTCWCILIQRYFLHSLLLAGKEGLSKGYWNLKRKLGVTTQFLEII